MSDTIQNKIEALLELARSEADAAKSQIADDLSEIIYVDRAPLNRRELDIATDILRRLLRETEGAVRRRMSERLAKDPGAPRELVVALANDEFMVARPILSMSAALRDEDLIEILRHKTKQHQLAVAARSHVSEAVSATVAEIGSTDVVAELLKNPTARIAEATYAYLAQRSKMDTELQAPLLHREDLPGEIAARMYGWVAAELKTFIETKYRVAPQILDAPMLDSLQEVAAEHRPEIAWDDASLQLADAIKAERINDPAVLVRLLKNGHVSLFEALLARYLDIGIRLARRIAYQPDGRALAVACRAAGIERGVLASLLELVRAEPQDALDLFRRISAAESLGVLASWRQRDALAGR